MKKKITYTYNCVECGTLITEPRKFNDQGPFCREHHTFEMAEKQLRLKQERRRPKSKRGKK